MSIHKHGDHDDSDSGPDRLTQSPLCPPWVQEIPAQRAQRGEHPFYPTGTNPDISFDNGRFSVFMVNMPVEVDYHIIFEKLRGTGKVSSVHVDKSDSSACARVEYFDVESALRLMQKGIWFNNRQISLIPVPGRVFMESNILDADYAYHGQGTRVLRVIGNETVVNHRVISKVLKHLAHYIETHKSRPYKPARELVEMEIRFISFSAHAKPARELILAEKDNSTLTETEKDDWARVRCVYGPDACDIEYDLTINLR
ncbi:hypothetical protein GGS21DRAFT_532493 [Xylaria nigripes]|nr:hypothetical protein GGS21DRAFT_532493 [Xylaria nigripes]